MLKLRKQIVETFVCVLSLVLVRRPYRSSPIFGGSVPVLWQVLVLRANLSDHSGEDGGNGIARFGMPDEVVGVSAHVKLRVVFFVVERYLAALVQSGELATPFNSTLLTLLFFRSKASFGFFNFLF